MLHWLNLNSVARPGARGVRPAKMIKRTAIVLLLIASSLWASAPSLTLFRPEILFTSFNYHNTAQISDRAIRKKIFNDLAALPLTEDQIKLLMRDCPRYVLATLEQQGYNTVGVKAFYSKDYPRTDFKQRSTELESKLCIVLSSVEKAKMNDRDVWIFLLNWEYGPPQKGKKLVLAHYRVFVIDYLTGEVLATASCM
jgi:hypothetical protein